jgi:holin-like protein
VGLLMLVWWAGDLLVRATGLPFTGSIAGFALLWLLLATRLLPERFIAPGADWLLARMLVLFVPAALAILDYPQLLGWTGLKVLFVIVAGSAIVMAATARVVCLAIAVMERRGRH